MLKGAVSGDGPSAAPASVDPLASDSLDVGTRVPSRGDSMKAAAAALLLSTAAQLGHAHAQSRPQSEAGRRLVGTWKLIETSDKERRGRHPTGLIMYDVRGSMSVQIMPDKPRPKFAGSRPTPEEAEASLAGYTAYFGTDTVDEAKGTVTHHRAGNIDPGGLGDFVRRYEFVGDERVILRPPENNNVLVRERVR